MGQIFPKIVETKTDRERQTEIQKETETESDVETEKEKKGEPSQIESDIIPPG